MLRISGRYTDFLTRYFSRPSIDLRQSWLIVFPLIAENFFTIVWGMVNSGSISSSGVTTLSAVSLSDTLNVFLYVFYAGVATGASVVVANYRGKGDQKKLHEASVQTVSSVTLFTIITAIFILLTHRPMLRLFFGSAEQEVLDKAAFYMAGCAFTLPLVGIVTGITCVLRGIGEGKTSMGYTIASTTLYAVSNFVLLKIFGFGIPGLIFSITVCRFFNVLIMWYLMKKSHSKFTFRLRELFRIDFSMLRPMMKIGMPSAIEQLFFTGGRLVTQAIIVPMGTNAVVTYNIAYSIMGLNQVFTNPVNTSMYTIVGICMGKKRVEDAKYLTRSYVLLSSAIFTAALGGMLLLFDGMVQFYNAPAEIIPMIFTCVVITGVAHPLIHSMGFLLPVSMRAAGDGNYCTWVSMLIMWIVRVFGGYVLGVMLNMGVLGIWWAMILDWVARCIVFLVRFRGTKWLKHQTVAE